MQIIPVNLALLEYSKSNLSLKALNESELYLNNLLLMQPSKALGIDYGLSRIGLSLSDTTLSFASALPVLKNKSDEYVFSFLKDLIQKESIRTIVIGSPLGTDDQPTKMSDIIRGFSRRLEEYLHSIYPDITIVEWNEAMTSFGAYENLVAKGKHYAKIKKAIDSESARIILQEY